MGPSSLTSGQRLIVGAALGLTIVAAIALAAG
jgi:hypothetical protein